MSGFAGELLAVLRSAPKLVKYVLAFVLILLVVVLLAFLLGFGKHVWLFVLGAAVITLLLFLVNFLFSLREKKEEADFEEGLRKDAQKGGASRQEVRQALRDLSQKWTEAMRELKRSGLSLYSLPWYMLIGEPQSGKSTTLANSGLEFPVGKDSLSGAGGTRNCDWWFSNEAVILDTAGRFTFQEDHAPDRDEWSTFLKLLRRHRPQMPINGVLVVVPCTSLLEDSPDEQEKKALNIRSKLLQLQKLLQIRFPIFLLVTKADRVLGFSEFFSKLDPEDQRQLFGWSSDEGMDAVYDPESFDSSFEEIAERIHRLRLKLLAREENAAQVDRLFIFPEELRALRSPLKRYVKTIFGQTRFDEPFLFRGFYVTSGVQQGKPIAQATRDLLGDSTSSGQDVVESLEQIFKKSRAFFIKDVYEKKVFPEQGLIARTRSAAEQDRKVRAVVWSISLVVILLVVAGMIPAYFSLRRVVNPIEATVERAKACDAGPCPAVEAFDVANELQKTRDRIAEKSLTFAMFLRGARGNELNETLRAIETKIFTARVVSPLLAETEARMGSMDWAAGAAAPEAAYKPFEAALEASLRWRAALVLPASEALKNRPQDLKIAPLIAFCRAVKGKPGNEVDEWLTAVPAGDPRPEKVLAGVAVPRAKLVVTPPALTEPIKKLEEFWTVANLARWDFDLLSALSAHDRLYNSLPAMGDMGSEAQLARLAGTANEMRQNWDRLTKQLAKPRPGEKGFPGGNLDSWRIFFRDAYNRLYWWSQAVPEQLTKPRYESWKAKLEADKAQLDTDRARFGYLLAEGPKPALTKTAETSFALLSALGEYADLPKYATSDEAKVFATLTAASSVDDIRAKVEGWLNGQKLKKQALLDKSKEIADAQPAAPFRWGEMRAFSDRAGEHAFALRVLPLATEFYAGWLGAACPQPLCFQPNFARAMIGLANAAIGATTQLTVYGGSAELASRVGALSEIEKGYLMRAIDEIERQLGHGGGGPGFQYPSTAATAASWRAFHTAVATWQPMGGGGGGAPPVDPASLLGLADFQAFAFANRNLSPTLDVYKARIRPKGPATGPNPDLLAAAESFKGAVLALSPDNPTLAWKQLSASPTGMKSFRAFSENPRLKLEISGRRMREVEDNGIRLLRGDVQASFTQKATPLLNRLNSLIGRFPFITDSELKAQRTRYGSGAMYTFTSGEKSVGAKLDLPTISSQDVTSALPAVGALVEEFGLEKVLSGEEQNADITGQWRKILKTANDWNRFLFALPGLPPKPGSPPRDHRIELRLAGETTLGRPFIGARVSRVAVFSPTTLVRPSTDAKTGQSPPPFVFRFSAADSPLSVKGVNEGTQKTHTLDITGGPLRLFYFVQLASTSDQDGRVWKAAIQLPETGNQLLEGLFEVKFEDAVPGVVGD